MQNQMGNFVEHCGPSFSQKPLAAGYVFNILELTERVFLHVSPIPTDGKLEKTDWFLSSKSSRTDQCPEGKGDSKVSEGAVSSKDRATAQLMFKKVSLVRALFRQIEALSLELHNIDSEFWSDLCQGPRLEL